MSETKKNADVDRFGWWVCACVKGGNWRKGRPSTHIKLNAPTVKKCRACGCTKAERDAMVAKEAR